VTIDGLEAATYGAQIARVDAEHSNVKAASSGADWPDEHEWTRLREADQLYTEELDDLVPTSGTGSVSVTLPQPGVVRIRLTAAGQPSANDEETTR
jgi:xylan 1,4-beta-xylosidase